MKIVGTFESFDHNILKKLQKRGGVEGGLCNLKFLLKFLNVADFYEEFEEKIKKLKHIFTKRRQGEEGGQGLFGKFSFSQQRLISFCSGNFSLKPGS